MMDADARYVIWSFEHDRWWRPGGFGYAKDLAEAGHYSREEAERIVRAANAYAKAPQEWLFPLERAAAFVAQGWHPLTPGTYDDGQGGLHLVLDEMFAFYGYTDTPENRETMIAAARRAMGDAVQVEEE